MVRPERESPGRLQPLPEPDAEYELDFGRYWWALVARWWLPAGALLAGALIGYLATLGGGGGYTATSQVYLGQPVINGAPLNSAPTTLALVSQVVAAGTTIRAVAARVGLSPAQLRGHITASPILGLTGTRLGTAAPLLAITVTGTSPAKVAAAANALGDAAVREAGHFQSERLQNLVLEKNWDSGQLAALNEQLAAARATQQQVLASKSIGATDKLVSLTSLNSVIAQALAQQITLAEDGFAIQQRITLVQDVEQGRQIVPALARREAGPRHRTGLAVGAAVGLIIGVIAALLWEPLASRFRARPAT